MDQDHDEEEEVSSYWGSDANTATAIINCDADSKVEKMEVIASPTPRLLRHPLGKANSSQSSFSSCSPEDGDNASSPSTTETTTDTPPTSGESGSNRVIFGGRSSIGIESKNANDGGIIKDQVIEIGSDDDGDDIGEADETFFEEEGSSGGSGVAESSQSSQIKAIQSDVVHQICSGQVIVTLSTAVKELVENALDAGATAVEVRLLEWGSSLIQVIDNGRGVDVDNFEGLALKHHTSKLSTFSDLGTVDTFGFRGEALSSLAGLTSTGLVILTRSSGSPTGSLLTYSPSGTLISVAPTHREVGTTVTLRDIFAPLPVRRAEFLKNLKREFNKMVGVLNGYCLIARGVRITVEHKHGEATTFSPVVSVPSTKTLRERIVGVFGAKQLASLVEFEQEEVLDEETLTEFGLNWKTFVNDRFLLEGYISGRNAGRGGGDRQFFFVNERPVDLPKISKIVNSVYNTFSTRGSSSYPFVCLNIKTAREDVDVNVTPDKRNLYLMSEKSLYAIVKASLVSLYTTESSSLSVSSSSQQVGKQLPSATMFSTQLSTSATRQQQKATKTTTTSPSSSQIRKMPSLRERFAKTGTNSFGHSSSSNFKHTKPSNVSASGWISTRRGPIVHVERKVLKKEEEHEEEEPEAATESEVIPVVMDVKSLLEQRNDNSAMLRRQRKRGHDDDKQDEIDDVKVCVLYDDDILAVGDDINYDASLQPSVSLFIDWEEIKENVKRRARLQAENSSSKTFNQNFRARISPGENGVAEEELKKQLKKDSFKKMEVVGQFNLGFIVAKSGSDLFIVDQHASDEKWNFEELEKSTVLQTQKLIRPLDLGLPAVSENIVLDHLETFRKNGFDFEINPLAEPTQRVKLGKIPFSKSCEFGKTDVEELIWMLEDCDEPYFCRPSKIRRMLASRACRKSVMIGKSLTGVEMRSILDHMAAMDQPWNCPHGRPTIRHLFNVMLLPDYAN